MSADSAAQAHGAAAAKSLSIETIICQRAKRAYYARARIFLLIRTGAMKR